MPRAHIGGEGEKNSPIKTQDTEQRQQKTSKNSNKQTKKAFQFSKHSPNTENTQGCAGQSVCGWGPGRDVGRSGVGET